MPIGGPQGPFANDAGGDLGSPSDPLGRTANNLSNAHDPTDKTPPTPSNFRLQLLPDGATIRLSCTVEPFAPLQTGQFINQTVRFYVTTMPLDQIPSTISANLAEAYFKRATLLQQLMAPRKGGIVVW